MSDSSGLLGRKSALGVFLSLPRTLVPGKVFLLPLLLGNAMGVRGAIGKFGLPWVILVVRSIVVARGHNISTFLPVTSVS